MIRQLFSRHYAPAISLFLADMSLLSKPKDVILLVIERFGISEFEFSFCFEGSRDAPWKFGFLDFQSTEKCREAYEIMRDGFHLHGRIVSVDYCEYRFISTPVASIPTSSRRRAVAGADTSGGTGTSGGSRPRPGISLWHHHPRAPLTARGIFSTPIRRPGARPSRRHGAARRRRTLLLLPAVDPRPGRPAPARGHAPRTLRIQTPHATHASRRRSRHAHVAFD
jgi:hypothetical protein